MAKYLLRRHEGHTNERDSAVAPRPSRFPLARFQHAFEAGFERMRAGYRELLALALARRGYLVGGFLGVVAASFLLAPFLGRNFFPQVDGGQILLHVRAPVGTRIEETAARFAQVKNAIRSLIPARETATIVDNIGTYLSSINTIYDNTGTIGESDGDIQIVLTEGHAPTADYVRRLRAELPRRFPGMTFSFLPADIVSQILNFGAPARCPRSRVVEDLPELVARAGNATLDRAVFAGASSSRFRVRIPLEHDLSESLSKLLGELFQSERQITQFPFHVMDRMRRNGLGHPSIGILDLTLRPAVHAVVAVAQDDEQPAPDVTVCPQIVTRRPGLQSRLLQEVVDQLRVPAQPQGVRTQPVERVTPNIGELAISDHRGLARRLGRHLGTGSPWREPF
jgi:hypothetical protein